MSTTDRIMRLADAMADAAVAHNVAVTEWAGDTFGGEWADIERLAGVWMDARRALREALADVASAPEVSR